MTRSITGSKEDFPEITPFETAILAYNCICEVHGDDSALSGDHFTGTCFVFFKGDYDKCVKVKEYVDSLEEGQEMRSHCDR